MGGKLIVIEGIDGSGKNLQSTMLRDSLQRQGRGVRLMSFPAYTETFFGREVGLYLNGEYGEMAGIHPKFAALLYAGDRYEKKAELVAALDAGDIVVVDRYVTSNVAHQGVRAPMEGRDAFQAWIREMEHDVFGMPPADATLLLDVPPDISTRLVEKKDARAYTDCAKDLHEKDDAYLRGVYGEYRRLAELEGWMTVECCGADGSLLPPEAIHAKVAACLAPVIGDA